MLKSFLLPEGYDSWGQYAIEGALFFGAFACMVGATLIALSIEGRI
jgi:hypothetical protein